MSHQEIKTKVCIIGAGPAGLLVANILRKYGINAVVIEKQSQTEIYAQSRSELIDYQTLAILQEHGLSDRLLRIAKSHGKCEFRIPEQSFILDYARMCDGQSHYTYPQQELLADLIYQFQQVGGQILFNTEGLKIKNERHGAKVDCRQGNQDIVINCDFIAGCDGFNGISRAALPSAIAQPQTIRYSYTWLEITAEVSSADSHVVYGIHPHGFAGQMVRNDHLGSYYLQVPVGDTVDDWRSDRIWSELRLRLAKENCFLPQGKIIAKKIVTMDSFSTKTMQHKSLFLAGDAAHVLTPAGEKGLNLALQDAHVLAKAFASFYRYHDNLPLKNYSEIRLPIISQAQEFSESLLHMLNVVNSAKTPETNLLQLLQKFKISQLMNSVGFAKEFARKYVGHITSDRPVIKPQTKTRLLAPAPTQFTELKPLVIIK